MEVLTDPEVTKKLPVSYPERARSNRLQGVVLLDAVINIDGSVGDMCVLHVNIPNIGFEAAAMKAVKGWRYKPATAGDIPVAVSLNVRVDFVLR